MGAVRFLRTLAPLALIACLATACGSGSSSSSSGTPSDGGSATTSTALEVRPVFARYSPGVQVALDPATASTLAAGTKALTGTDVAYSFQGKVLTSVIVDPSFNSSKLAIIGTYDKAQAS